MLTTVLLLTLAAPASAIECAAEAEALWRANYGPDVQITGVIHREDGYANQAYPEVWMTTDLCQGGIVSRSASHQGDMANPIHFGDTPKGDAKRLGM